MENDGNVQRILEKFQTWAKLWWESGGKFTFFLKMSLFGRLMHQYLQAPMASCHHRCDDGHHPSAEFSEWLWPSRRGSGVQGSIDTKTGEGLECVKKSFLPISRYIPHSHERSWSFSPLWSCQASCPVLRCFLPMAGEDIGAVTCRDSNDSRMSYLHRSTVEHRGGLRSSLRAVSLQEPLPLDEEWSWSGSRPSQGASRIQRQYKTVFTNISTYRRI